MMNTITNQISSKMDNLHAHNVPGTQHIVSLKMDNNRTYTLVKDSIPLKTSLGNVSRLLYARLLHGNNKTKVK